MDSEDQPIRLRVDAYGGTVDLPAGHIELTLVIPEHLRPPQGHVVAYAFDREIPVRYVD